MAARLIARGPTKRLRCVNPTLSDRRCRSRESSRTARDFYRTAGLPAIFRLLPFAQPVGLDAFLAERGLERIRAHAGPARRCLRVAIALPAPARWKSSSLR